MLNRPIKLGLMTVVVALALAGCSSSPKYSSSVNSSYVNFDTKNACSILRANPGWKRGLLKTQKRWGIPPQVTLAIIKQESNFRQHARPIRNGKAISSAYGYSQALKGTWKGYQKHTKRWSANRDSFYDSIDFIGWYVDQSNKRLGISKWSPYHQYLAYHEGQGGYKKRTYRKKPWLIKVANKLKYQAWTYNKQLRKC